MNTLLPSAAAFLVASVGSAALASQAPSAAAIATLVASYGYAVVFAGALLEGETLLVAAGFAAHQGLLAWPLVVLTAIAGATLGDQLSFWVGRWKGRRVLMSRPAIARREKRLQHLLDRFDVLVVPVLRFLYGLRIVGPAIIGASRMPATRFALLNVLGAVLWAILVSGAGYLLGTTADALIGDLRGIEELLLLAMIALGLLLGLWRRLLGK